MELVLGSDVSSQVPILATSELAVGNAGSKGHPSPAVSTPCPPDSTITAISVIGALLAYPFQPAW